MEADIPFGSTTVIVISITLLPVEELKIEEEYKLNKEDFLFKLSTLLE